MIAYLVFAIQILNTNAQCGDAQDAAACIASSLECAYSTASGCIPMDETPFIYIGEKSGGYTWYEAEARCQTLYNSHLASVRSAQEHEWAVSLCQNRQSSLGIPACWIGGYLYYNDGSAEFQWIDGADFVYGASPYAQPPWQIGKAQPTMNGCDAVNEVCCLKVRVDQTGQEGWTDLPNGGSCLSQTEPAFCRSDCICADDGNICTEEVCIEGECVHNPVSNMTDCSTDCIPDGQCFDGACIGNIECGNVVCDGLSCCNDENPCMENAVCSELVCSGDAVLDGISCTVGCAVGTCANGQCLEGAVDCSLGCDGTPCDDGDDGTTDDICVENVCVGVPITASPTETTNNATPAPTESSESLSSDDSSDDFEMFEAEAPPNNNALPEAKLTKYYSLTVHLGNDTDAWIYVCFIVGVFFLCNGILVFYWCNYKRNAEKT